jgi:hypothetical protein
VIGVLVRLVELMEMRVLVELMADVDVIGVLRCWVLMVMVVGLLVELTVIVVGVLVVQRE